MPLTQALAKLDAYLVSPRTVKGCAFSRERPVRKSWARYEVPHCACRLKCFVHPWYILRTAFVQPSYSIHATLVQPSFSLRTALVQPSFSQTQRRGMHIVQNRGYEGNFTVSRRFQHIVSRRFQHIVSRRFHDGNFKVTCRRETMRKPS